MDKNGVCQNLEGTFGCKCDIGYTHVETKGCLGILKGKHFHKIKSLTIIEIQLDIDECDFPNICMYGVCMNNKGSFTCNCNPGMIRKRKVLL